MKYYLILLSISLSACQAQADLLTKAGLGFGILLLGSFALSGLDTLVKWLSRKVIKLGDKIYLKNKNKTTKGLAAEIKKNLTG